MKPFILHPALIFDLAFHVRLERDIKAIVTLRSFPSVRLGMKVTCSDELMFRVCLCCPEQR